MQVLHSECCILYFVSSRYYDWFITNHELLNGCPIPIMDSKGYVLMHRIIVFNLVCGANWQIIYYIL